MPYEEYTATHRFHPYYMIGQLDYSKEVLIPRKRNGEDGFFVLNPLYCYDGGQIRFNNLGTDKSHIKIKRAAVVINRGWIPYHLKDKKKRPHEINSRELMKIRGVWRQSELIHDYRTPNNTEDNEWNAICVEDIAGFWELPNEVEMKFFYFEQIDLEDQGKNELAQRGIETEFPVPTSKDELINDEFQWYLRDRTYNRVWKLLTAVSVASLGWGIYWI